MNRGFMAFVWLMFLLYLFLGISIIADIFMEAIEVICSKTKTVEVRDKDNKIYFYEQPVWNPTIANLTLMALGSSAPEILLATIDAINTLGETPGELGVFGIIGSAAYNLLCISAICIVAVDETPKKINDLLTFATTSVFSIWAYIWMYIVFQDKEVEIWEAWLTIVFFILLLILAYAADRFKAYQEEKKMNAQQIEEKNRQDELKIKKSQLRDYAKKHGEAIVLSIGQGNTPKQDNVKHAISDQDVRDIRKLFMDVMGTDDLSKKSVSDLLNMLQPDSLLERFAYKKANNMVHPKDFVKVEGQLQGQIEQGDTTGMTNVNDFVGFKCLHYSVTESSGFVEICVVKNSP